MKIAEDISKVSLSDDFYSRQVENFAKRILLPSVELVDNSKIQYLEELKGTAQFISYFNSKVSQDSLKILSPDDVWKLSTFVTYIGDNRDISTLNDYMSTSKAHTMTSTKNLLLNIIQAANFTLAAFSGDCNDYSRLYAAVELMSCNKKDLPDFQYYTVAFTPYDNSQQGHMTNLFSYDGITWHANDFFMELTWKGSPWEAAHVWGDLHSKGFSGYAVSIATNYFISPNIPQTNVTTYLPVVGSAKVEDLVKNKYVNPTRKITKINHTESPVWPKVQRESENLFSIEPWQSPQNQIVITKDELQKYLPYIIGGSALVVLTAGK